MREARVSTRLAGMSRRIGYDQTQRARALRNGATRHERKLWAMLSRLRPKFTRQLPVGPYFADFACRGTKHDKAEAA